MASSTHSSIASVSDPKKIANYQLAIADGLGLSTVWALKKVPGFNVIW